MIRAFCVQAFHSAGRGVERELAHHFETQEEALSAAEGLRSRRAGVAVYAFEGSPQTGVWGEPRLLARFGKTWPMQGAP